MNKKIMLFALSICLILMLSNLASAVIFDVQKARQKEWESYKQYKQDYADFNNLEGFEKYLDERNLMNNFGFYGPGYYYIPPKVLAAKYNPPLQGDAYCTDTRGCTTSLNQPSAVKFYGEKMNGKYYGYIPSTTGGKYFDHPQINGAYGYITVNSNYGYGSYNNYYNNDHTLNDGQARYYARVSSSLNNGFYVVGFY